MSPRLLAPSLLALSLSLALQAQAQAPDPSQAIELDEVMVRGVHVQPRKGTLTDEIVATEAIGEKMIERVGATNINEAVDKNPGISVQVECSICNVRNVLLNNLPGRYTTLMIDGVPIHSSVSSAYGLDSISVHGVERIDVARGAGVSLVAPEALSGSVNIISKRPQDDQLRLRLEGGNFGSRQGEAYYANAFDQGALALTASYNTHDSVDGDGDRISEFTGFDRKMAGLGFFFDDVGGFKLRGRLDWIDEKRGGGALGDDYRAIRNNMSGNPFNFCAGVHGSPDCAGWVNPADGSVLAYEDGRGGFSEIIFTRRRQLILSGERALGDSGATMNLALGAARHLQDSFYEGTFYDAKQAQYYGEASVRIPAASWWLTFGLNQRFEDLHSHGITPDGTAVHGLDDYLYRTPAVFAQAYTTFLDEALELNLSLRHDDHNVFGGITSPRLNLLYHHSDHLSSRFSAGRGFRAPTSFFEQDHGILDTLRIQREIDEPEISRNFSYALNYFDDRLAITASLNYNRIDNFALLDSGQIDANGDPYTLFTSADEPVTVKGADVNFSYLLTPGLSLNIAAETSRYDFTEGTLVFARPENKAYLGFDFESGPWDISARATWTGAMDLERFYGNERFDFDGNRKRSRSPSFTTVDARVEYAFNPQFSFYLAGYNLFDYKQVDHERFLFIDPEGAPDVTHIWGPNLGRAVRAGIKYTFQ